MNDYEKITDSVYWVGHRGRQGLINCNPYLVIENGEGVLIDPGSTIEFDAICENVKALISLDRISLIVVNHPDPDIASGIPEFYRAGLVAPIALHWRTSTLIRFYGIQNPFYIVNEEGWKWSFRTGRKLAFVPSPYCHFPGSVMTYDETTSTLFSGDLFGSLTAPEGLYAGADYMHGMRSFHEHYIPSHQILAPVMDSILPLKINRIAPQHGQIITNNIPDYIFELRNLKCGTYLGNTEAILSKSAKTEAGDEAAGNLPALEPVADDEIEVETIIRDMNTGLLNGAVYRQQLTTILARPADTPFSVLYFSIDNLEEINQLRGRKIGDEAIRSLAYLVKNNASNGLWKSFKLDMPYIAAIADGETRENVRVMADKVRRDAIDADFTTDRLTVSAGIIHSDQIPRTEQERKQEYVDRLILARLFRARKNPSGSMCDYLAESDTELYLKKKILLIEPDETYVAFLEPFFTERGYLLMTAADGSGFEKFRDEDTPDLVIAEAMTPRINGFELREKMLSSTKGKSTPFVLISRRKDEEFVRRAAEVGIVHFLKKPFLKTELIALVDNLLRHS